MKNYSFLYFRNAVVNVGPQLRLPASLRSSSAGNTSSFRRTTRATRRPRPRPRRRPQRTTRPENYPENWRPERKIKIIFFLFVTQLLHKFKIVKKQKLLKILSFRY